MGRYGIVCAVLLTALPCLLTEAAWADGKGFPRASIEAPPDIPQQQAVIAFRSGQETLIVESTFETPSPEIGWVLPLPSAPSEMAAIEISPTASLAINLRPRCISEDSWRVKWAHRSWIVLFLLALLVIPLVLTDRNRTLSPARRAWRIAWHMLVLLTLGSLVLSFFLPSLSTAREEAAYGLQSVAGITEIEEQVVGSYDVTILQADTGDALDTWLAEKGLATMSLADRQIVDSYIDDGWVFSVARLRTDDGEPLTPHSLSVTFPCDSPVYPMRLTSQAGGDETYLRLFVVADGTADVEGMDCMSSDVFRLEEHRAVGEQTGLRIYHPAVRDRMWPSCTVTHLAGRIPRQNMTEDIQPYIGSADPQRVTLYSTAALRTYSRGFVAVGLIASTICTAVLFANGRKPNRRWMALPVALVVIGAVTGCVVATTGRIGQLTHLPPDIMLDIGLHNLQRTVAIVQRRGHKVTEDNVVTIEAAEAFLHGLVRDYYIGSFERGYAPGQYHWEKRGNAMLMVVYLTNGDRKEILLEPAETPETQPSGAAQ